ELTRDLRIEPRWSEATARRVRLALPRQKPADPARAAAWAEGWCTLAWQAYQDGRKIDAQEALRALAGLAPQPARARKLRGEMKLRDGDTAGARAIWTELVESGEEDVRVRIALGTFAADAGELEEAERQFLAAEKDFPGLSTRELAPELALAKLYSKMD